MYRSCLYTNQPKKKDLWDEENLNTDRLIIIHFLRCENGTTVMFFKRVFILEIHNNEFTDEMINCLGFASK